MDGYSERKNPSEGVHDRLTVRVIYLEDGASSLALISCDVCWFSDQTIKEINQTLSKIKEIDNVLIFATHNHSGPAMTDVLSSPNELTLDYLSSLPTLVENAALSAVKDTRPVSISFHKGKSRLIFNRRRPRSGPIDTEVVTALFKDKSEKPVAALVNYACHPTILGSDNLLISSDWPGCFASKLDKALGSGTVTVLLNGPAGDILPFRNDGSFSDVEKFGQALCQESLLSLSNGSRIEAAPVISYKTEKIGPLKPFGLSFELCAAAVGNLVILSNPGEAFASTGMVIRESVLTKYLMIACYSGAYRGYFPTPDAFNRKDFETGPLCWADQSAEEQIRLKGITLCDNVLWHR